MTTELKGIVHGNTIQLDRDLGLPDGHHVVVVVRAEQVDEHLAPGEGIKRAAGSWSDDPEGLDAYLEWNRQQRKVGRRPLDP
jgi:hypothetical protein